MLDEMNRVKQAVVDAVDYAKSLGATSAEVSISKTQGIQVSSRLGEVETVEFNHDGALGIAVWNGQRKGSASTSDLSPEALKRTVAAACDIAKYTSEDEFSGLADEAMMVQPEQLIDLDLYHPADVSPDQAIELTKQCEQAALDTDKRITNSDGASFSSHQGFRVYGNSYDVLAAYPSSRHSLSCAVIAEQDGEMQRDYDYTVSRLMSNLDSAKVVGDKAAREVLSRLGGRQIDTCKVPVIYRADIASSLFGHFIAAISGGNLYRKSSFLLDKLNTQVFPDWLTIHEDPLIKQGLASSTFDHEGVATQARNIVEAGELKSWLLSSYAARKLGLQSTGNAGGIHNWLVQSKQQQDDFAGMLKKIDTGLLVTEMMGQGVNVVTGDYSRGAAGFWVENGQIQYPVSEITIAGNLEDMFKNIVAIGNDLDRRGSLTTGSVMIEEMQVAGS